MDDEMISITKIEYEELHKCRDKLFALESAGVDNWEGYDIAIDILEERDPY